MLYSVALQRAQGQSREDRVPAKPMSGRLVLMVLPELLRCQTRDSQQRGLLQMVEQLLVQLEVGDRLLLLER